MPRQIFLRCSTLRSLSLVLVLLLTASALAGPIEEAKTLWALALQYEQSFDPRCVELISDRALFVNTRRYPNGKTRVMRMTGKQYKLLLTSVLELARQRGDTGTYSDVKFQEQENGTVKITATRYSNLKKYSSPVTTFVGPENGKWVILKEFSESRP